MIKAMDNLRQVGKYAQFRYTPHDDEIRSAYGHILSLFPENFTDTEYREEIALLMAQINSLLTLSECEPSEDTPEIKGITNERWRIVLDTIKLKAALIRDQRNHNFRLEKAKLDRLKIDVIPKDEFVTAVSDIVNLVKDYLDPEMLPAFVGQMQELMQNTTKRSDTIEAHKNNVE